MSSIPVNKPVMLGTALACSVIIPSYCAETTITACLTSLVNQDFQFPFEIIVVDSSPDATPALVRHSFPQVQQIHLERRTDPAAARNLGAHQARGEILAFIDADCVAGPEWLAQLHHWLVRGYDGVGGAIANGNGTQLVSWASYMCEFREFLPGGSPHPVENLTLGNVAYRRAAFEQLGGFPVGWFPQEDQIFHRELRARGMRLLFDPQIVVAHTHRSELPAFLAHQRTIGRANARVLRQTGKAGAQLASRPLLAALSLPALVLLRFVRTLYACRLAAGRQLVEHPELAWLCWRGMLAWGAGFVEGAANDHRAVWQR